MVLVLVGSRLYEIPRPDKGGLTGCIDNTTNKDRHRNRTFLCAVVYVKCAQRCKQEVGPFAIALRWNAHSILYAFAVALNSELLGFPMY